LTPGLGMPLNPLVLQERQKKTYAEMYGLCIGHIGRSGMDVQVNVERFVPQLRAVGDHESVEPNEKARREHIRLLGSLLPEKRVVGECHTHPYSAFQEMINIQGGAWGPSKKRPAVFQKPVSWLD
jgi:hypothetical protein